MEDQDSSMEQNPAPLAHRVYASMREDIIKCTLPPGSEVTETAMAERYEVGKAPVRAALSRLFQEALVKPQPRRGYLIAPITLKDIHESMAVRVLLEAEAARLAATRMSEADLAAMRLDTTLAPTDDWEAVFEKNRIFHVGIADATGNGTLANLLIHLLDRMERVSRLLMRKQPTQYMRLEYGAVHADHKAILDAIARRKPDEAERAMRDHLDATLRMTMEAVAECQDMELRVSAHA